MKYAEIIIPGNELLDGNVVDTNSPYLAQKLLEVGVQTRRKTFVRDDVNELVKAIEESLSREPDYLLITGGLGITRDDVTREGLSKALNKSLTYDENTLRRIEELLKKRESELREKGLTETRKGYARIIEGSKPIYNQVGAACGMLIEKDKTKLVVLPGVPEEMKAMVDSLIGKIFVGDRIYSEMIYLGRGEESEFLPLHEELSKLKIEFGSYPKGMDVYIKIKSEDLGKFEEARKIVEKYKRS
ncbi:MAG: molybdopterin-binding protein [Candidatus Aenigmarchaeota archaeon]|nr:molybdopterin-binding protein [Candidatus Aenigmarchaeota archaeon]